MKMHVQTSAFLTVTFCALIYTCDGIEFFKNTRDLIGKVQNYMGHLKEGVAAVIKQVEEVENFFDVVVEEECHFKCPKGLVPRMNHQHVPSSNGCGSLGLRISQENLPVGQLTKCCDEHDLCYDTCGTDKDECDLKFKKCLYKTCEVHTKEEIHMFKKTCKGAAKLLYTGTLALGCKSFIDAQQQACTCQPEYGWKEVRDDL